jgi:plasmid stabilization system protein ParE
MAGYDLADIWKFIARDDPEAADRVEAAIYRACAVVAQTPSMGQLRKHSTKLLVRFWTVTRFPNYVCVYRPETRPLRIIRILHGKRNIQRILKPAP